MGARGIAQFLESKNQHKAFLLIGQLSTGYIAISPVHSSQPWRARGPNRRRNPVQINIA
jgi:hypothetical protein